MQMNRFRTCVLDDFYRVILIKVNHIIKSDLVMKITSNINIDGIIIEWNKYSHIET